MNILVIIPIYNEVSHIRQVIQDTINAGFSNILVVDDGSTDNSAEIARLAGARVISHLINRGQGAAITTGMAVARQENVDIIITLDGDSQFTPDDCMKLVCPIIHEEYDMVIGNRFIKNNKIPIIRRCYNIVASLLTFFLSGTRVQDSQSGFKALGKKALDRITLHTNGYEFCSEMIREAGYHKLRIKEVGVRVFYTKESMRKGQNFATGLKTAGKLVVRSLTKI